MLEAENNHLKASFAQSNLESTIKNDILAETALRTTKNDNLSVLVTNIKIYASMLIQKRLDEFQISKYKFLLQNQLADVWFQEPLKDFRLTVDNAKQQLQNYPLFKNLSNFEDITRELIKMKSEAQSEEAYQRAQSILNGFFKEMQLILEDSDRTIARLNKYDVYGNNQESIHQAIKQSELPIDHYSKELIDTKINYSPIVFTWVNPPLHQIYISQVSKAYHQIVPVRIKHIMINSSDSPTINRLNYFESTIGQKAILAYCVPGTKNLGYYAMDDICKLLSIEKQYYQQRQLSNDWVFSVFTKTVTTPDGRIFAINCRSTKQKLDTCLYQITDVKASNRGPLPSPKRQSSIIYANKCLYVIGGFGEGQKCSKKNFKYNIKQKKWSSIAESNIALRKPTLCVLNNRYICKIGGLNQFDYINKVIQIYDPQTDKWSLVRANAKNIMDEVQILEDSLAVQINDDQIYVFSGKNSNKYSADSGFILQINEIKQRRKGAAKVSGQFWNVSIGKKNILTFFGLFSNSNVLIHHNCIYALRVSNTKALSI